MKQETKLKKQLDDVKRWVHFARQYYYEHNPPKMSTEFYLVIALEQFIKYEEMKQESK